MMIIIWSLFDHHMIIVQKAFDPPPPFVWTSCGEFFMKISCCWMTSSTHQIYNIVFEHGFEQCSKKLHFSYGTASLRDMWGWKWWSPPGWRRINICLNFLSVNFVLKMVPVSKMTNITNKGGCENIHGNLGHLRGGRKGNIVNDLLFFWKETFGFSVLTLNFS